MMPTSLVRETPVKPAGRTTEKPKPRRAEIVTRAEIAPCTCPEHCERDHEND
jgi:hypothetical protein